MPCAPSHAASFTHIEVNLIIPWAHSVAHLLHEIKPCPSLPPQQRIDQLAGANAALQQERAALATQLRQLQAVGQELSGSCRALEARLQGTVGERDSLKAALAQARAAHEAASQRWEQQRQHLEAALGAANGRLTGSEESGASLKSQVQELQTQLERLQSEARDARTEAARREQELQAELRLLFARSEAAAQAARDSSEAAAAAAGAEAARQHEALRAKELELEAARKDTAALAAEQQRLQVGAFIHGVAFHLVLLHISALLFYFNATELQGCALHASRVASFQTLPSPDLPCAPGRRTSAEPGMSAPWWPANCSWRRAAPRRTLQGWHRSCRPRRARHSRRSVQRRRADAPPSRSGGFFEARLPGSHAHSAGYCLLLALYNDTTMLPQVEPCCMHNVTSPSHPCTRPAQAQTQAQAAVAAHTALAQQRKELQGRLDRLALEAERAARARETAELQCGALQQQCRLLEAVARGQAALGGGRSPRRGGRRGGGSKENDSMAEGAFRIKARQLRGLALSPSSSD